MRSHHISVYFEALVAAVDEAQVIRVISKILDDHKIDESEISVIFVDDDYITRLNSDYFGKLKPTDVISFPLSEADASTLEGEVYIGTEVAREQAAEYSATLQNELFRLVIHGVLHLLGYDDMNLPEKSKMTAQEDFYLHYIFAEN